MYVYVYMNHICFNTVLGSHARLPEYENAELTVADQTKLRNVVIEVLDENGHRTQARGSCVRTSVRVRVCMYVYVYVHVCVCVCVCVCVRACA
jgi:hypothetical protein